MLLEDGEVRERGEGVTLRDILRKAEELKVDAIATDNVYELASSKEELIQLLRQMDHAPRLVQVTVIRGKVYKLESIAASLGLFSGRLSPIKAAEVCAKLAYMGVGSEVVLFEDETRIVISSSKSSKGGMSSDRYRRNAELLVLRLTREIASSLRRNAIDFDLYVKRSGQGLESSVFIVYAPRARLKGIVKNVKTHDVKVEIEPVTKREMEFVPLGLKPSPCRPPNRYMILGVDPGTCTGVAALSLDGRPLFVMSKRWLSRRELTSELTKYGKVALIATDVNPPPLYVKKLASALNAPLFIPSTSMSVEEKRELVASFISKYNLRVKIRDSHQRDALAAAIKAFRYYTPKFTQVDRELDALAMGIPRDEVKALVLKGYAIHDAIKRVSSRYLIPEHAHEVAVKRREDAVEALRRALETLERRLSQVLLEKEELKREKKVLEEEVNRLNLTLDRILKLQAAEVKRSRIYLALAENIKALDGEIKRLRRENEELKRREKHLIEVLERISRGEVVCLPISDKPLPVQLRRGCKVALIKGGRVDDELLSALKGEGVDVILTLSREMYSKIRVLAAQKGLTVACLEGIEREEMGNVVVVSRTALEEVIKEAIEKFEREHGERILERLRDIVEEYRRERVRAARLCSRRALE